MPPRKASKLRDPRKGRQPRSEVTTTRVDPGTDWTLDQARDMLDQGYTADRIEEVTGWARRFVEAPRSGLRR
jgi:hypothetical protein